MLTSPVPSFLPVSPGLAPGGLLQVAQTIATAEAQAIQNAIAAKQALFTGLVGG